jgi:type I restriction enzyme S subunit
MVLFPYYTVQAAVSGYHNEPLVDGPSIIVGRKGTVSFVLGGPCVFPIDTVFFYVN